VACEGTEARLTVPTIPLRTGGAMPRIGLGTSPMTDAEAESAVATAIGLGYRLIDTAFNYNNEAGVGRGIAAGGVDRAELFVTTKLNASWHGVDAVREAWQGSVDRLGLERLDLFLIHWPNPAQDRYVDAWRGLVRLREEGLVHAIGVSNFKPAHLTRLIEETGVVPDVNQIQLNPRVTRDASRAFHEAHGIVTESWSPIGQGRGLLEERVVVDLAARYRRTAAQIVLRWHIELGLVAIPKTSQAARMAENLDVFDFTLVAEDVAALSALDRGEGAAVDSDVFGH